MESLTTEFARVAIDHMETSCSRIKICLNQLSESDVWHKPNENTNSIANLILHLCGNITQYIPSAMGRAADQRKRNEEFSLSGGLSKKQLFARISKVTKKAVTILKEVNADELQEIYAVQGFHLSGMAIIVHVVEHYSYHVGQIALQTKLIQNKDLGFYAGMDLNQKNE